MAFHACGIDHVGPFTAFTYSNSDKNCKYEPWNCKTAKYSVLVFTCPLTGAVHLELCDDEKIEGFMNAFDSKFSNAHSVPVTVYLETHKVPLAASRCQQIGDLRVPNIYWKFSATDSVVGWLL